MNHIIPRPSPASSFSVPSSLFRLLVPAFRRHASSSRRTAKKLRVKPDQTFTSSIPPDKLYDHIVFNPPSSAPSVYHTPAAFLPPSDPRRQLLAESFSHANPYDDPNRELPPPARRLPQEKRYHLREEEIAEIRRLRTLDPNVWTRKKLAEKFDCSQFFVGMVVQASKEKKEKEKQILESVKEKWGRRKRYAREDRRKRRELWERDE
ncbi:hypothetical protein MMC07_006847 [Pseudocyphellaria aurata]|nr:hypothetical protein [Pseudocyphellaria aurata]